VLIVLLLLGGALQVVVPLAPPVPPIAMGFLIATQLVGDGAPTVYLINEATLVCCRPNALGRAAATWTVANGVLTPTRALTSALLAELIGLRPTLWMLAAGGGIAAMWLAAARRAIPGRG
jgi:hypothetical protein